MMNQKILSIVVPVYNMQDSLAHCLDSLLVSSQELMQMLEVIVVNDGSSDGTSALAHGYETRFPGVFYVIDKENGNSGSCINAALAVATGKYFRQLDADDWLDTEALEQFIPLLMEHEEDCVSTPHNECYPNSCIRAGDASSVAYGQAYSIDDIRMTRDEKGMLFMHSLTFRLDLLRRYGHHQQEGIYYTDIEQCYFALANAHDIYFCDLCLYQYRLGWAGQSVVFPQYVKNRTHMLKVSARLLDDFLVRSASLTENRQCTLADQLLGVLNMTYMSYLFYAADDRDFLALDQLVVSSPEICRRIESYWLRGIPYIKMWHDFGLTPTFLHLV